MEHGKRSRSDTAGVRVLVRVADYHASTRAGSRSDTAGVRVLGSRFATFCDRTTTVAGAILPA